MTIRLHPATPHGDRLHRYHRRERDARIAWTVCGIRFAFGSVQRSAGRLPRCETCS